MLRVGLVKLNTAGVLCVRDSVVFSDVQIIIQKNLSVYQRNNPFLAMR